MSRMTNFLEQTLADKEETSAQLVSPLNGA